MATIYALITSYRSYSWVDEFKPFVEKNLSSHTWGALEQSMVFSNNGNNDIQKNIDVLRKQLFEQENIG